MRSSALIILDVTRISLRHYNRAIAFGDAEDNVAALNFIGWLLPFRHDQFECPFGTGSHTFAAAITIDHTRRDDLMLYVLQFLWGSRPYGRRIGVYEPDAIGPGVKAGLYAFEAEDGISAKVSINLDQWPGCHIVIFVHIHLPT